MTTDRDRFQYRLTPVAELKPGDRVVTFHADGRLADDLTIESVDDGGSAYWGGRDGYRGEVHGYTVTYREKDPFGRTRRSTAGRQACSAVVIKEEELEAICAGYSGRHFETKCQAPATNRCPLCRMPWCDDHYDHNARMCSTIRHS